MKTPVIDYTEEKLAIANELGLPRCAAALIAEKEAKREVEELTNLKFKAIDREKIDKMINKRIFRPFYHTNLKAEFMFLSVLSCVFYAFWGVHQAVAPHDPNHGAGAFMIMGDIFGTISAFIFIRSSFPKCAARGMLLKDWEWTLPRGALLALKEAKDAGLDNFKIFYPVLEEKRVKVDPVIVGYKPGIKTALMVHAWDDGKVHD